MVIPKIPESKQGKELLLEIDSIVPDTTGHHLADVSLSSNDSLSRSRRRWNLIKIVSKMNPSFNGKSKKLIFYQSLSAILSLILTGIAIYWLVQMKSTPNSPSSRSSSELNSDQILNTHPTSASEPDLPHILSMAVPMGVDSTDLTQFPGESQGLANFNLTEERPVISDDDMTSTIYWPYSDGENMDSSSVPSSFPSAPLNFVELLSGYNEPELSQPEVDPFTFHFEVSSNEDSEEDEPEDFFQRSTGIDLPFIISNFDSIKSRARNFHASALTAFDDLMGKIKASPFGDFLSVKDEGSDAEKQVSVPAISPTKTEEPKESTNKLDETVDRVLMLVRKFAL